MAIAAFASMLSASTASAADFEFKPSFSLIEEYNDNVFLTDTGRKEDYITRALPSIRLDYASSLWKWDLSYAFDYRYYARGAVDDESTHRGSLNGNIGILKNIFFLRLSDSFERVSLNNTRDVTQESLFVNQSDRNTYEINPYLVLRPTSTTALNVGYKRADTWYDDPTGVDKTDDVAYVDAVFDISPRTDFTSGYRFTSESNSVKDFDKHDIYAGASYEYGPSSNVHLNMGGTWLDFEGGDNLASFFGSAGLTHDFDMFVLSLDGSIDVTENPRSTPEWVEAYSLALLRKTGRGSYSLSLNFSDYKDLETRSLRSRVYGTSGRVVYNFNQKLSGTVGFTAERIEDKPQNTYTRRFLVSPRLDYALSEGLKLALVYNYADYHSPAIASDNYRNNRFSIEIRKTF